MIQSPILLCTPHLNLLVINPQRSMGIHVACISSSLGVILLRRDFISIHSWPKMHRCNIIFGHAGLATAMEARHLESIRCLWSWTAIIPCLCTDMLTMMSMLTESSSLPCKFWPKQNLDIQLQFVGQGWPVQSRIPNRNTIISGPGDYKLSRYKGRYPCPPSIPSCSKFGSFSI